MLPEQNRNYGSESQDSSKSTLTDYDLNPSLTGKEPWISENTAIMVVHGIGHQQPNETLDLFARGLIQKYQSLCKEKLRVSHRIETLSKQGNNSFQNIIRVEHPDSPFYMDIYEYYWAYCTEDKVRLTDINSWLHGVVDGARKFYSRNKELGEKYGDSSPFFKDGKFIAWKYNVVLKFFVRSYLLLNALITIFLKLVAFIPFVGGIAEKILKDYMDRSVYKLTNLIGDIVIYNVSDEKSKFYSVRVQILEGAVQQLQSILEKSEGKKLTYTSVLVAGHSLGSQIAYDSINKINLLASLGQLKNYDTKGYLKSDKVIDESNTIFKISDQLRSFITFGSPLDKIVFFLRTNIPDHQYIRQQIMDSYHCFKQREWSTKTYTSDQEINRTVKRLLDDIPWYNYYDGADIISGGLDYFSNVMNIDCTFNCKEQFKAKKSKFTHGHYWNCRNFYEDIIRKNLARYQAETIFQKAAYQTN